jgi:2-methylcitrate dehydratase PrpD
MASALLNRKLGLAELRDEFVRSDKVQALMRRVRVTTTDQADPHARDPIGLAELRAKFDDCTGRQQRALFERLLHLDAQPSVAALYSG